MLSAVSLDATIEQAGALYISVSEFLWCYRRQLCKLIVFAMTALNEALTAEVQRLKIATAELNADASKFQQLSLNPQMFQSQQQQSNQLNMHQLQQQQQQQQSSQPQQQAQAHQQLNNSTPSKHESK